MVVLGLRKSLQDQDEQSKNQGVFKEETSRAGGYNVEGGRTDLYGKERLIPTAGV